MAYRVLGIAALLASALRAVVPQDDDQAQIDAQQEQINAVRSAMDGFTSRISALQSELDAKGAIDTDQAETLEGLKAELADMATVLAGPAGDTTDNGVIAQVQPVEAPPESPAADAIVEQQTEAVAAAGEQEQEQEEG